MMPTPARSAKFCWLSEAWWRAGIGRAEKEPKRVQAWPVYAGRDRIAATSSDVDRTVAEAAARHRVIEDHSTVGTRQQSGSGRRSLRGTPGRRLLRRRKEQIGRHTETGAQTLHHRHAKPLFPTHYFTDAAWRAEQRDEVSSREAVLIHQVADQIGDASAADGAISFPRTRQQGALAPPTERRRLDRSSSIAGRRAPERAIARHRHQSG
jgi:hypothetical protein